MPIAVAPVPPFRTGRVPVTCVARLMRPASDENERQVPEIAKQPLAMFQPPVETRVEVAVVKFPTPCTERMEPGVEVPMPTSPFAVIVSAGVEEVANDEGEEVER